MRDADSESGAQTKQASPSKPRQFYKKEHRWQEGLVSAAQAVGWGANELVTAAEEALQQLHSATANAEQEGMS